MTKKEFLNNGDVQGFISWFAKRLDQKRKFKHEWIDRKRKKEWSCDSIYDAYCRYSWNSQDFEGNNAELADLSMTLKNAIKENDVDLAKNTCIKILAWGGVKRGNADRINKLGDDLISYLNYAERQLKSDDLIEINFKDVQMTAGFSKIYSLYIDDFMIYDGRVSAALGLLVRLFCDKSGLSSIPKYLQFSYGKSRSNCLRDPNVEKYGKKTFTNHMQNPVLHIQNNLKANWLLKEILDKHKSKFNDLPSDIKPIRALEAALFMIGYDLGKQE